jgi:hypothetical protein
MAYAESYAHSEGTHAPRQVEPHPKPLRRVKASSAQWSEIREGFAHATCVHCGLEAQSLHHIVPKSQGGDDVPENLAPLCGDGTRGCHGKLESHGPGWERVAAAIRQYVITNNARRHYAEQKLGARFNRRYPPLPNTDPQFESDFRAIYGLEGK